MADSNFVDDGDSRIVYSAGWFKGGGSGEADGTTHGTVTAGATATFTFTGTSVAVFGTIGTVSHSVSTYSIDGSSAVTFTATPGQADSHQQLFFQSPQLGSGEHTLVITSTSANNFFWLDYIQFTGAAAITTSSSNTSTPHPTNLPATTTADNNFTGSLSPGTSLSTSSQPASATSSPSIPSSSSKVPTAAISAVVGGVSVLLIGLFLIWRRRRKSMARRVPVSKTSQMNFRDGEPSLTPLLSEPPTSPPLPHTAALQNAHSNVELPTPTVPFHDAGFGYTTHGGSSQEKVVLHYVHSSQSSGSMDVPTPSHSNPPPESSQNLRVQNSHPRTESVNDASYARIQSDSDDYDQEALADSPPAYQATPPTVLRHKGP